MYGRTANLSAEQLFLELALRGYDLSKLQDNEPQTVEIVNIAI